MTNTAKSIIDQAMELSSIERSNLAEKLISSLDVSDSQRDTVWAEEADRRIEAYERGEMETVSIEEAFKKYQR